VKPPRKARYAERIMRIAVVGALSGALGGCNQVFGLHDTSAHDAAFFDAPIDAPPSCPSIGMAPRFSPTVHQVIPQNCVFYTASADTNVAAAYCLDLDAIADGAIDGSLTAAAFAPPPTARLDMPRLTPEGDEMWVRRGGTTPGFAVYRRTGPHAWSFAYATAIPRNAPDDVITAPTRQGPNGRRVLRLAFGEFTLYEYIVDGTGAVTPGPSVTNTQLGVTYMQFPNLSADGLRLVFAGAPISNPSVTVTMYADRASVDAPFSPAQLLTAAPVVFDPFLTEDCARLYTNGLGSIFYAQQE